MIKRTKLAKGECVGGDRLSYRLAGIAVACAMLMSGCIGDELSDLREHVTTTKAKKGERIPPLPTFETYMTVPYAAANLRDPFLPVFVDDIPPTSSKKSDSLPPRTHKPEPLEMYPLDGLKFVGLLERQDERWAIISAPDKLVHRVKVGNYLGQNYGRITSITESKVEVMETVSDGMGGWIERPAALSVVE